MNLKKLKNYLQQASKYEFTVSDIPLMVRDIAIMCAIGRLFYGSYVFSILLFPIAVPWFVLQKE